jgi:hypothetical protein
MRGRMEEGGESGEEWEVMWRAKRSEEKNESLFSRLVRARLEVSNEIRSFLFTLKTSESHLSLRDVLLGVKKVLKESLIIPVNTSRLVGRRVSISGHLAGLTSPNTVQVGSLLVSSTLIICFCLNMCKFFEKKRTKDEKGEMEGGWN